MLKRIPSHLFFDYALVSVGYFLCLVALRPYKFSTWRITETVSAQAGMHGLIMTDISLYDGICVPFHLPSN